MYTIFFTNYQYNILLRFHKDQEQRWGSLQNNIQDYGAPTVISQGAYGGSGSRGARRACPDSEAELQSKRRVYRDQFFAQGSNKTLSAQPEYKFGKLPEMGQNPGQHMRYLGV